MINLLLCLLTLTSAFKQPREQVFRPKKDYALFVAVQDYQEWSDLHNPIKDAQTIADELKNSYGFETEVVINPTYQQILEKLETYRKKQYVEDGQLLIFFSGHGGFNEDTKEGFFVPGNGKLNDPHLLSYLLYKRLKTLIESIRCNHILLAIDACYSGTFDEHIALNKGWTRPKENALPRDLMIKKMLAYKSRLYLTSGGKERTSDGVMHSPFTAQFLIALRDFDGDIKDGILSWSELRSHMEKANPLPLAGQFGENEPGSSFLFVLDDYEESSVVDRRSFLERLLNEPYTDKQGRVISVPPRRPGETDEEYLQRLREYEERLRRREERREERKLFWHKLLFNEEEKQQEEEHSPSEYHYFEKNDGG